MKIAFVLTLMNDGDTAAWKEQLIDNAATVADANMTEFDLGTWKNFEMALKETFEPYDAPGDALEKMKESRLLTLESPPTTLDEWYMKAGKLDNACKCMQKVTCRTNELKQGGTDGK